MQPCLVKEIAESIVKLNDEEGLTVLVVEQNLDFMQTVSQRAYVIDKGSVVTHLDRSEICDTDKVSGYLAI